MDKTILSALLALTMLSNSVVVHAAFFDELADKVIDRVGDTISDKFVNKAGDKAGEATDAVIGEDRSETSDVDEVGVEQSGQNVKAVPSLDLGGLNGMMDALQKPVTIDDSYSFPVSFITEVTSGGKTETIKQSMADHGFAMEVSKNEVTILDFKNRAMIMLDHQKKTKTAMSTDLIKTFAGMAKNNDLKSYAVSHITKTGKTKKILGYTAELWEYQDNAERGEAWIAKDVYFNLVEYSKKLSEIFGADNNSRLPLDFSKALGDTPTGYPLETTHYVNGKLDSQTKVIKIIDQTSTIKLNGYQLQNMMAQ